MTESESSTPRPPDRGPGRDRRTGRSAAAARIQQQAKWVDLQVRQAMERGEFDDLPGAGKPIAGLGTQHDPDWWLKQLIEHEKLSVLPPALALRKEDLELDALLDTMTTERDVRRELEDFNQRVVNARRQLEGGPPVVTPTRDVEAEIAAWTERRTARIAAQREHLAREQDKKPRRWFRRR